MSQPDDPGNDLGDELAKPLSRFANADEESTSSSPDTSSELTRVLQEQLTRAAHRIDQPDRHWTVSNSELESVWQAPERIGRFEIRRELGRGGMGVVFLAFDPILQRDVALKVPRPEAILNESLRQRFLSECQAAAALRHPHVVPVYEAGQIGKICYIASEFCSGPSLKDWLDQHDAPVTPHSAERLIKKLAEAVAHAHSRGILHRDLKPSNVMMVPAAEPSAVTDTSSEHTPMLTDFGLAKAIDAGGDITQTDEILGTPQYMAPEQAQGFHDAVGGPTDIHALGVILYEVLTGRRPFDGETTLATLRLVQLQAPISPRVLRPNIPRDLAAICLKCLEKIPSHRYDTADDLAEDLRRFLDGDPIVASQGGIRKHITNWCLRPQRIRNAGILLLTLASLFLVWCLIGSVAVLAGGFQTTSVTGTLLYIGAWTLFFYLPMIWLGRETILGKSYAIRAAWLHISVAILLLSAFMSGIFLDKLTPLLGDPEQRRLVDLLVYGAWWLAWGAYLLAFLADRQSLHLQDGKRHPNGSRRTIANGTR